MDAFYRLYRNSPGLAIDSNVATLYRRLAGLWCPDGNPPIEVRQINYCPKIRAGGEQPAGAAVRLTLTRRALKHGGGYFHIARPVAALLPRVRCIILQAVRIGLYYPAAL